MNRSPESSITILIIEDEMMIRTTTAAYLEDNGFSILEAANGREGLEKFRRHKPDFVLVDLRMPELDGFDVLKAVTKESPETPIVVVSGTGTIDDVIEAIRLGAWDFITKPIHDMSIVEHTITKSWERSLLLQENRQYREYLEDEVYKRTREVKESEAKFRSIVQTAAEGIILIDGDGSIISWNQGAAKTFGYTEKEIIGQSVEKLIPERYRGGHTHALQYLQSIGINNHTGKNLELRGLHKEGHELPLELSLVSWEASDTNFFCGIVRDITERKKAEEEKSRLVAAVDQATEVIVITDKDGLIQYVNPAFERITGYSYQEAVGQNPRILQSNKHDPEFYKSLWDTISKGQVWQGHIINKRKNGTFFEEEMTISPIRDETGTIFSYVAVKYDVTHEIQMEKQLRQAQKMEAIGTLAGGIAHDFNNILFAMLGYIEILKDMAPKDSPMLDYLLQIRKAGVRAKDLVRQILTFSRQGEQSLQRVIAAPVVKESLKLLRSSLPTTIDIQENIFSPMTQIMATPTQIQQIFMNLCTNAGYVMRKGGTLTVELVEVELDADFAALHDLKKGRFLKLSISDTGDGIPPEIQDRIFEPFFTTKPQGEGTGMGLAMVHGIVKNLGGTITVSSTFHQGTTFDLYFPAIMNPKKIPALTESNFLPQGKEHILLVDDDEMVIKVEKVLLEDLGYQVTTATNGPEALEIFHNTSVPFDLVLTDLTMPKMTGEQLAQELTAIFPQLPVLLTTGFNEGLNEASFKKAGIRALLAKPIEQKKLADTLHAIFHSPDNN
ncbi:MAG: PAS domain S-box protein [SAR324 cluster bacterium]|nr:PAS domain S-box protein [SAR324 cluster bacterium]